MRAHLAALGSATPSQVWLNIWLVAVLAGPFLTLIHELGHVLAARLVGFPVRALVIGKGRAVVRRRIRGVHVEVRSMPYGGLTMFEPVDTPTVCRREAAVAAAGPLTDLFIGLLAVAFYINGLTMAAAVGIVEVTSFAINLLPRSRMSVSDGIHANDGWQLLRSLHGKVSPNVIIQRASALRAGGRLDEALKQLDGISDDRALRLVRQQMIVWLIDAGRFEDARTLCIHELWSRGGGESPEHRGVLLNNAAYSGVLARNPAFLAEDRAAAIEAQGLLPANYSVMNTTGLVLALSGEAESAVGWCERALSELGAPPANQAVRIASLAIAKAVKGDIAEVDSLAAAAMRMHSSAAVTSLVVTAFAHVIQPGTLPAIPVNASGRPDVALAKARCEALGVLGRWSDATLVAIRTLDAAGANANRQQRALLCKELAWCSLMSGDPQFHAAAAAAVQGLEALGLDDPAAAYTVGWWCIDNGEVARGVSLIEQSLQSALRPQERATALATLALGRARSGDPAGAQQSLAEARQVDAAAPLVAMVSAALAA